MSPYEVLGISPQAGIEEIKNAYRKLAKLYHPDRVTDDQKAEKEDKFKEISAAYEILSDPTKKSNYDRWGSVKGPEFGGGFGDIFSNFMNMGGFFQSHVAMARNINIDVTITLEEAFSGLTKEVIVRKRNVCDNCHGSGASSFKPCTVCNGLGFRETRSGNFMMRQECSHCRSKGKITDEKCKKCNGSGYLEAAPLKKQLQIPKGVFSGAVFVFNGEGEASPNGQLGHLYVQILIKDHDKFTRCINNTDLLYYCLVNYSQLFLGAAVTVPTLHGKATLKLPPRTQPGDVLRLKGKGMPHVNKPEAVGDLLVEIKLFMPNIEGSYLKAVKELAKYEPELLSP